MMSGRQIVVVGYITYTSDDVPPPTAEIARIRRRQAWLVGLMIYVFFCGVFIWWLQRPPPIKPPLAIVPLPDEKELRLLGGAESREIQLRHSEDFGGRLRVNDYYSRGYASTS